MHDGRVMERFVACECAGLLSTQRKVSQIPLDRARDSDMQFFVKRGSGPEQNYLQAGLAYIE